MPDLQEAVRELLEHPPASRTPVEEIRRRARTLRHQRLARRLTFISVLAAIVAVGTVAIANGKHAEHVIAGPPTNASLQIGSHPVSPGPLTARTGQGAIALDPTHVFVWGGRAPETSVTAQPFASSPYALFADGAIYDVATGEWTTVAASPLTPREQPLLVVHQSLVYVLGGSAPGTRGLYDYSAYDPASRRWSPVRALPTCPRAATAQADTIVIVGSCGTPSATLDSYRLTAGQWAPLGPLPFPVITKLVTLSDGTVIAWSGIENHAAALAPGEASWTPIPTPPFTSTSDNVILCPQPGAALEVITPVPADGQERVVESVLNAGRWSTPLTLASVAEPQAPSQSACSGDAALWAPPGWLEAAIGSHAVPVRIYRLTFDFLSASLVPLGSGKFLTWGGMVATRPLTVGHPLTFPGPDFTTAEPWVITVSEAVLPHT